MGKKTINDIEVDARLADAVSLKRETMGEAFINVPMELAYWTERCSQAKRSELLAKHDVERAKAEAHIQVKESVKDQGIKATVGDIEAQVKLHPGYREAIERLVDAESDFAKARGYLDVIRAKKDVLSSLSQLYHEGELSIGEPSKEVGAA